jgi:t-SNARE complex subunit (syntaxin)
MNGIERYLKIEGDQPTIDDLPTSSRAAEVRTALDMVDREREERERLRRQLAEAVALLDDVSDVLAEVQRGELSVDDARVNDVLRRAVLHVNGGQSDPESRKEATG